MYSLNRMLWLLATAVGAYATGCLSEIAFHSASGWGPTPLRDFVIMGGIYIFLVAPATYAAFSLPRRMGLHLSTFGYGLLGACLGVVPALLLWAAMAGDGFLFVIMAAQHGIPAGVVLGLGYSTS
jgi:hypothetical protein